MVGTARGHLRRARGPGGSLTAIGYDRQWAATTPATGCGWVPDRAALAVALPPARCTSSTSRSLAATRTRPTRGRGWSRAGPPRSSTRARSGAHDGCTVDQCSKAITSIGTPSIWWGGTLAVFVLLFMWALRRDWRAGAILGRLRRRLPAVVHLPGAARSTRSTRSPSCRRSCSPCVFVLGLRHRAGDRDRARRRWRLGAGIGGVPRASAGAVRVLLPALHRAGHPVRALAAGGCGSPAGSEPGQRGPSRNGSSSPGVVSCTTRTASCGSTSRTL